VHNQKIATLTVKVVETKTGLGKNRNGFLINMSLKMLIFHLLVHWQKTLTLYSKQLVISTAVDEKNCYYIDLHIPVTALNNPVYIFQHSDLALFMALAQGKLRKALSGFL